MSLQEQRMCEWMDTSQINILLHDIYVQGVSLSIVQASRSDRGPIMTFEPAMERKMTYLLEDCLSLMIESIVFELSTGKFKIG